ncbi:MAG TPA: hypothetical protein VMW86_03710 [Dehalococcoidales bacterium]|nr:hypothetical protein [Dehalococcoidales bacterium]
MTLVLEGCTFKDGILQREKMPELAGVRSLPTLSGDNWFISLNLEITTKGMPEATLIQQDRPKKLSDFNLWDYVLLTEKVEATISFPLQPETLGNIVFTEPGGFAPSQINLSTLSQASSMRYNINAGWPKPAFVNEVNEENRSYEITQRACHRSRVRQVRATRPR